MKMLHFLALLNALTSLLASVALSAMTVIPSAEAERSLMTVGIILLGFLVIWLAFAAWLKRPSSKSSRLGRSPRLRRFCVAVSVLYLLATLIILVG